jgi:hypothetical protein
VSAERDHVEGVWCVETLARRRAATVANASSATDTPRSVSAAYPIRRTSAECSARRGRPLPPVGQLGEPAAGDGHVRRDAVLGQPVARSAEQADDQLVPGTRRLFVPAAKLPATNASVTAIPRRSALHDASSASSSAADRGAVAHARPTGACAGYNLTGDNFRRSIVLVSTSGVATVRARGTGTVATAAFGAGRPHVGSGSGP